MFNNTFNFIPDYIKPFVFQRVMRVEVRKQQEKSLFGRICFIKRHFSVKFMYFYIHFFFAYGNRGT